MYFDFAKINVASKAPSVVWVPPEGIEDRLDAYPYDVRFLTPLQRLFEWNLGRLTTISELAKFVRCGPFGSNLLAEGYSQSGVCVIRPFNISDWSISTDRLVFLPEQECHIRGLHIYKNNTLIFARVGNIAVGCIPNRPYKFTISPNIIAAEIKDSNNSYYLCAFLNSKYGVCQLERALKVVAQPTISTDTVRNLRIPISDRRIQDYIGAKVELADRCRAEAATRFKRVQTCLAEVLGVDPFQKINVTPFTEDTFQVLSIRPPCSVVAPKGLMGMIGAHCYEPIHIAVEAMLDDAGVRQRSFTEIAVEVVNGFDCREFIESGTPYIKVADLKPGRLEKSKAQKVAINPTDIPKKQRIRNGDLLITRKGSYGICASVMNNDEDVIISSEIIRVRLNSEFNADYVAAFLNSEFGHSKFDRVATGTMMLGISHGNLADIRIPWIDTDSQKLVATEHRLWRQALETAEHLISEAKSDIEALIEGTLDTNAILSGKLKPPTWETINESLGSGTDE